MSRPETTQDVNSEMRHLVVTLDQNSFPTVPTFYNAVGAFLASCEKLGMVTEKSYSTIQIYNPYTTKEKEQALKEAQQQWDRNYKEATDPNEPASSYRRDGLIRFAEAEGLPTPEWA
jgi:hypothetical protein